MLSRIQRNKIIKWIQQKNLKDATAFKKLKYGLGFFKPIFFKFRYEFI